MDDGLVGQMSEYAICWALRHHRDIDKYAARQQAKRWQPEEFVDTIHRRVGVLGLGTIGQDTTRKFALLGFPTMGWSRTPKAVQCVKTFHGPDGLDRLLARANTWSTCCRSPSTRTASRRAPNQFNMARGGHMVDEALLAALNSGHLAGTALDVFNIELLPPDHRYWTPPGAGHAAHCRRHQFAHRLAVFGPARPAGIVPDHHVEMRSRHVVGHEFLEIERGGDGALERP